ncbi:MAG TPA: hypothetical protein DD725_06155 [Deltaproteobacteria bacterium]|nr:hypothetical protein [Deltaproteobacteria bacterium]
MATTVSTYTDPIYSNPLYAKTTPVTTAKDNTMGKEAFLTLLIAQLKNQDPLNPMKDTEFVSQLASFSSLEQMSNMSKSLDQTSAMGLIGKQVTDKDNITGVVTDVNMDSSGNTKLNIAYKTTDDKGAIIDTSKQVALKNIKEIKQQTAIDNAAANLIGMRVTDKTNTSGVVSNVRMDAKGVTNLTISYQVINKEGASTEATKQITMADISEVKFNN